MFQLFIYLLCLGRNSDKTLIDSNTRGNRAVLRTLTAVDYLTFVQVSQLKVK